MKKLAVLFIILFALPVLAQNRGQGMMNRRVEEYEKVKLIEALNLDETKSIQFFTKRRAFREKQRNLNDQLDSLTDKLKSITTGSQDKDKLKDVVNQYINTEKQMHTLKNNYMTDIKSILTDEEIARLIVFERDFRQDIQQMIMKRNRRGMRGNSED